MTDSPAKRRTAPLAVGLAAPLVLVMVAVATRFHPLMTFDSNVVRTLNGAVVGTGWARFFRIVAVASQGLVVWVLLGALALWFAIRRENRLGAWVVAVLLISQPGWTLLKQIFQRSRPGIADQIGGYSFPSGHATGIAALMGVLVVLTAQRVRDSRLRTVLITACVSIALLVGVDRVFLGAHYPSDVTAGWLIGSLVVLLTSAGFGIATHGSDANPDHSASMLADDPGTLAVILNPTKVDALGFKVKVGSAARAAGWDEPLWFETTSDDAGASMARAAVAAGADVVVAAGGDGTVRVVCAEMAGSGVPVGVIPTGTGNLLARNLGISLNPDRAVQTVLMGQNRRIDVVRIEGDQLEPTRFVVMAGLGLDAAIMDGAADSLKATIGWPAYVVAGARHLRYPAMRADIEIDGGEPVRRRARTVVIGNVGNLQGGIPLLPDAEIDDGLLDVVVIAPRRLFGWLPLALRVITKRRRTDDKLDRFTGRSVVITAASATPRQLDGDTVGAGTTLRATIEPGVLLVRVPR